MVVFRRSLQSVCAMVGGVLVAFACGGCGGAGAPFVAPISVSLSASTIVVPQNGVPAHVQITIKSTSETALVNFVGLPGGVEANYAASDTNPSGLLTFTAKSKVSAGTYMPIINVNSAGQSAMLTFTMVVPAG
jgi:hypothetical protein